MDYYQNYLLPLMCMGPWAMWDTSLQEASYQALCLRFDWLYGFRERWPEGFDAYLSHHYGWLKEEFLHSENLSYVTALDWICSLVIDDLHTGSGFAPPSVYVMTEEEYLQALANLPQLPENMLEAAVQTRTVQREAKAEEYQQLRSEKIQMDSDYALRYYEDMAVLTIDTFATDTNYWENYTLNDEITSEDTPGFLYRAFEDIQNHPAVKKVVFDITNNRGGEMYSILTTIGFMKQEFYTDILYGITDISRVTTYRLDTNRDGNVDEQDSMENQYKFYILQSGASYSSAHVFAYLAQLQNAATIIGEQNAGGSCAIRTTVDAHGLPYSYSGLISYGVGAEHLQEVYVEPDIELSVESWYDDSSLLAAINDAQESYTLTVVNGQGSGEYKAGDAVLIEASIPDGKRFQKWTWNIADSLLFSNGSLSDSVATVIMPESDLILTANFVATSRSQGCYVATAVYGSYDCPEVWTLRRFRDTVLAKTWYGRLFIRFYYAVSPTLVRLFGETQCFQDFWRIRLDRMVSNLQENGFASTPYHDVEW